MCPLKIPFLDIMVYLEDMKVMTDVYYKTTDTHQYLHFSSCHPRHTKHSIPYSQARRLCTIIDDETIRDKRLKEMKDYFIARGYPETLVDDGIARAKCIPQATLRQVKPKEKTDMLPFVFTHNPQTHHFSQLLVQQLIS